MSALVGIACFIGIALVAYTLVAWIEHDIPPWDLFGRPAGLAPLDDAMKKWVCSYRGKQVWFVVINNRSLNPMWADTGMTVPKRVEHRIDNELKRIHEKERAAERQKDFMNGLM